MRSKIAHAHRSVLGLAAVCLATTTCVTAFEASPPTDAGETVAYIDRIDPGDARLADVARIRRSGVDVTGSMDLRGGDQIFMKQSNVALTVRMLATNKLILVRKTAQASEADTADLTVESLPGLRGNVLAWLKGVFQGVDQAGGGSALGASRAVNRGTCYNDSGKTNEPVPFRIPILAASSSVLAAGSRAIYVSWEGGAQPFSVTLSAALTGRIVTQSLDVRYACAVYLPQVNLPPGQYRLTVIDANNIKEQEESLFVEAEAPASADRAARSEPARGSAANLYDDMVECVGWWQVGIRGSTAGCRHGLPVTNGPRLVAPMGRFGAMRPPLINCDGRQARRRREGHQVRRLPPPEVEAARERCMALSGFVRDAWHVLEPTTHYVHDWHHDAISEHLEAIHKGDITRLQINQPPGTAKSFFASVCFNAWEWGPGGKPGMRYLTTAYMERWARTHARKTRDLVTSPWYQSLWPNVALVRDSENTLKGVRMAMPFASLTSGRGNRVIIDDPHSTEQVESDADRERAERIFRESVTSRLNDPQRDAIVVIMHRLHRPRPYQGEVS
jgi:hypothetical protein